jgi:peptidoglycan/LPS O-acetylase OafA/YrhL
MSLNSAFGHGEQVTPSTTATASVSIFDSLQKPLRGHIPALDGIRGCAILMVMIFHFGTVLERTGPAGIAYYSIKSLGWSGVDLFFVLSGFLITGILLTSKDSENYFQSFYMRRILRIFPLYYSIVFLNFLLLAFAPSARHLVLRAHTDASIQWWYVFYLQNWIIEPLRPIRTLEHFWSLAIEEQFYLVWPMLVYLTSRRTLSRICVLLPLVSLMLRIGLHYYGFTAWDVYQFTITRLDGLALGAFLAVAVRDPGAFAWIRRFSARIAVIAGVALAGMGIHYGSLDWSPWPMLIVAPLLTSLLYASCLARVVSGLGTVTLGQKLVNNRWLRSIGKYSYAMYALHNPIHKTVHYLTENLQQRVMADGSIAWIGFTVVYTVVLSAISYGLARISWWALESRFLKLKDYFTPATRA